MTVANFIIAGTEKAGTTSVFSYLSQHPQVAASRRKETDFFRSPTGGLDEYAAHFPPATDVPVVMEASPGYLGEAAAVVPRMRELIPGVRLLFILREPVARFLSSFHFHRARLNLPQSMEFRDYIDACLRYVETGATGDLGEWFLKVLPFGGYAGYLQHYFEAFPAGQIRVAFYEDLGTDPRRFMETLSRDFLHIDADFWAQADFQRANVTFGGRNRLLHRLAVIANDRLEPLLRPRPALKSAVVGAYKRVNGAREGYDGMAAADRCVLEAFYAPHNESLENLLGTPLPAGWVTRAGDASGASRAGGGVAGGGAVAS